MTPRTVPGVPTSVSGVPADSSVVVSWSAPASDGGSAVTGYTVTSSPGAKTCVWSSGPLSCTVTGLANGTAYTFSVVATNTAGESSASTASVSVTPKWVPDSRIAYECENGPPLFSTSQICIQNAEGTGSKKLSDGTSFDMFPEISPDGSRIAYVSDRDIWVMSIDGSEKQKITNIGSPWNSYNPSWSPDGRYLVYSVDHAGPRAGCGGQKLRVVDLETLGVRDLTSGELCEVLDHYPAWSPDGTTIVYARDVFEFWDVEGQSLMIQTSEIRTILPDGSDDALLRPADGWYVDNFDWAPDGDWIAYQAGTNTSTALRGSEIRVMRPDGTQETRLSDSFEDDRSDPSWSPDGTEIAYHGGEFNTSYGIWIMAFPLELSNPSTGNEFEPSAQTQSLLAGRKLVDSGSAPSWGPYIGAFTPSTPSRVFDTRPGEGGLRVVSKQKVGGLTELRVKVTDLSGLVPASGVGAVSLNVTVTEAGGSGFVTVYPCGTKPNASSLNYVAGQTVPNAVIAPVSAQGEVCFYSQAPVHLLADVNGWFAEGASFTSVTPSRVFDTRPGEGGLRVVSKQKVGGLTELRVKVTDLSGLVPASGVGAVSLNVTVTEAGGSGFVTVYPCGTKPNASSLNYVAGQTVPNAVIAPVSPSGDVCFYSQAPVHLLADVNGWFVDGASFTSVTPSRVFDTRPGEGGLRVVSKQKVGGLTELRVKVTDLSGLVPASGVGAVSLNVTVTEAGGSGFVTVYPCGTKPNASSLNYVAGQTVPNAVIAPVSPSGDVCFYSQAPVHLLADVNGWFAS